MNDKELELRSQLAKERLKKDAYEELLKNEEKARDKEEKESFALWIAVGVLTIVNILQVIF